jgi:hypothetical protein
MDARAAGWLLRRAFALALLFSLAVALAGESSPVAAEGTTVYITPFNGTRFQSWRWDGRYIGPFNALRRQSGEWDGSTLKPFGARAARGWDGRFLRPYEGPRDRGWAWDGRTLRPLKGTQGAAWEWDGRYFWTWGSAREKGFAADSPNVPVPVLALVADLIQ